MASTILRANQFRRVPGDGEANSNVKSGDTFTFDSGSTLEIASGASVTLAASVLAFAQTIGVPLTSLRVFDAPTTLLPATAGNDDMGLIGTGLSAAQTLQSVDFGGTTADEKAGLAFVLPPTYRAGATISVVLHAGMLTTVSDGTATVDVRAFSDDGDGTISADICATAAQSINSLTLADKTFVITPTGLVPGQLIYFSFDFAASDTGNLGVMIETITKISISLGA